MNTIGMKEKVEEYIFSQFKNEIEILSCKPESTIEDFGVEAVVWNVKTDKENNWWVVTSDTYPMNLYPQFEYYFGTDEVFSFHIGLMQRVRQQYDTEHKNELSNITFGTSLLNELGRKLKLLAENVDSATEVEEFQSIGVMCRETLIMLGNYIFEVDFLNGDEEPKVSDFKNKSYYFLQAVMPGRDNKELRKTIKDMTNSSWDYANKVTHSTSTTIHDASITYTLCVATVSLYEKLIAKYYDPISNIKCMQCGSKKIELFEIEDKLNGKCMNCSCEFTFVEDGENLV